MEKSLEMDEATTKMNNDHYYNNAAAGGGGGHERQYSKLSVNDTNNAKINNNVDCDENKDIIDKHPISTSYENSSCFKETITNNKCVVLSSKSESYYGGLTTTNADGEYNNNNDDDDDAEEDGDRILEQSLSIPPQILLPLKFPVSILSCEILKSSSKCNKCIGKSRPTTIEYILTIIIQQNTHTKNIHSKADTIEWNDKILTVIDQTSRIDKIFINISTTTTTTRICCNNERHNSSDDRIVCKLELNIINEIKNGVLFPKTYKMDNSDAEIVIDIQLLKLHPILKPWKTYNEVLFCFYINSVTIEKPKYFKKQYFVQVVLKNASSSSKKYKNIPQHQQTTQKPCVNDKILYNSWIFMKIDINKHLPLLRMSICDANSKKIKGSRMFLPQDGNLTSENDNLSVYSSMDTNMNAMYTINPALPNNTPNISKTSTSFAGISKDVSLDESNHETTNANESLFLKVAPPSPVSPVMKQAKDIMTLGNHTIGDIHFFYGYFHTL